MKINVRVDVTLVIKNSGACPVGKCRIVVIYRV